MFSSVFAGYAIRHLNDKLTVSDLVGTDGVAALVGGKLLGFSDQTVDVGSLLTWP